VFNLSWDRSTMLWTWLSGARWKLGIEEFGRPRLLSLFYTHSVESPDRRADNSSMADFYFAPMKLLGFSERVDAPQLVPSGCDLDSIDSFLSETLGDRSFVLIHPGSRLSHKRWPEEHFLTFVKMLSSRFPELAFVLACGPGESKWAASWMESFPGDKSLFLPNPTLGELIALAARCALFVGNDSGPMHLAAATGCPVLALFANPSRWEPLAEKKRVVIAPGGKMSGLRPEEVFKAAEELLLGISGADRAPHPNPLLREWGGSG
jgi:heptosyltransferase III